MSNAIYCYAVKPWKTIRREYLIRVFHLPGQFV
jgi:hypothetical protein